jgi:hypothetical protein
MPHSIILTRQKLDCVAAAFPAVASSANALKAKCNTADAAMQIPENESTEWATWHEVLHEVQETATDWCDNGAGGNSTNQMIAILDNYSSQLP